MCLHHTNIKCFISVTELVFLLHLNKLRGTMDYCWKQRKYLTQDPNQLIILLEIVTSRRFKDLDIYWLFVFVLNY